MQTWIVIKFTSAYDKPGGSLFLLFTYVRLILLEGLLVNTGSEGRGLNTSFGEPVHTLTPNPFSCAAIH